MLVVVRCALFVVVVLCALFVVRCVLRVAGNLLLGVCYVLFACMRCCSLTDVRCSLLVVGCLFLALRCLLFAVCCVLYVVC